MEILPKVKIVDLFLYIAEFKTLVIGDAHIGYEASLTKKGILIPKFQFKEIVSRVKKAIKELKPKKIIIVGDLKHEFGSISNEEWRNTRDFIELLQENSELVLIKGNHDTILKPIADKYDLKLHDYFVLDKFYFCHGHKVPNDSEFKKAKIVFMGHEHPAIGLKDGPRTEIYKCFLKGKFKRKDLIVLPSLASMPEGSDILKEKLLSPLLTNLKNFRVFIIEDKIYDFGLVKNLK